MTSVKLLGEKYVIDGSVADLSGFNPDMSADIYYEVVRLIDGKFLFLEDHLQRLERSMAGSGISAPGRETIRHSLVLLQTNNPFKLGNVRICIQTATEGEAHLLCYFISYFYPEICMYKSGIQVMTYPHVRSNPGIKKWDDRFRISVGHYIRDHGIYEAILLNAQGQITEGSRSNIFFITPDPQLVSPPEEEILPGITRKYILEICRREGIEVIHRPVPMTELNRYVSCFITGTSPKVLPVWQLNGVEFQVNHPILQLLMEQYELVILQNLEDLLQ
jgi:branched-chain amino acid aminotransferase